MSADRVETEWHLTPRGWEEGATTPIHEPSPPPQDRVLTIAVITTWPSQWNNKKTETQLIERWRNNDQTEFNELTARFGSMPPKTRP